MARLLHQPIQRRRQMGRADLSDNTTPVLTWERGHSPCFISLAGECVLSRHNGSRRLSYSADCVRHLSEKHAGPLTVVHMRAVTWCRAADGACLAALDGDRARWVCSADGGEGQDDVERCVCVRRPRVFLRWHDGIRNLIR